MPQQRSGQGTGPRAAAPEQGAPGRSGASPPLPIHLATLLQVPGLAVWQWEVATNRVDWNESLRRLYGVIAGPTDDLSFLAFVHPEDRERVDAETVSYVSEASSFSHEFRIIRPDGEVRWILDRGVVERGEDGSALRLVGVNFDVTAERQAQERAAVVERRATLASRIAGFVTWEIDAETTEVIYETGLATMFGMPAGRAARRVDDFGTCIHPEDLPATMAALASAKVPGGRYEAEFRVGSPEAGWRWLRGCGEGVATPKGLSIVGFNVDITAEREAQAALQASEAFVRSILDSSPDCIKVLSLKGGLELFSQGGLGLMEVDDYERQLHGAEWASLWSPEEQPKARAALAMALAGGTGRFQAFLPTLKGTPRWWDVSVSPIPGPEGAPEKLLAISRDITELHRAEEARQLLVEELDHRLKNLFTIAAGMVNMTARTARSPAEMASALSGRLLALSRAHNLIRAAVKASAKGGESARLADLVGVVVEPYLEAGADRVRVDGPALRAGPKAATSLALVLHELATNAAKYGALSNPEGSLEVTWGVQDDALILTWQEQGGPTITSPPVRKGFGSQLARLGITGQLGGTMVHDWQPAGVLIRLQIPLEQIVR
ncbi:PAS domain S-box protein [Rubellimicrobium rubrum]|uniref:histidine kinase n=1 Tax=Rubellimicrobium rubrum TaxID=2585369 RepID=A0A5C4N015_9RHOB|nr:PAS domain-containing protein [Rubellimicrobium rubrum]TNC49551.1 PAS domain S-box protein [Rubellimicrobium rubrum]